jgi:peptide chain release factor 1
VECQEERSQFKNRDKAMKLLQARLYKMQQDAQNNKIASERKSQVGTGERCERIRTYNFPQGRVTDHRIGMTVYNIDRFMNGEMDEILQALAASEAEKLVKGSQ